MDFAREEAWWARGHSRIVGVDEVGRGPLAGPVVAAAVCVPQDAAVRARLLKWVDDSKKLSKARREIAALAVRELCEVQIGVAEVSEIDDINILQATFVAMRRAVDGLGPVDGVLVDGRDVPQGLHGEALIGGDGKELAIACASVVAKVWRDNLMVELHARYPGYGWDSNVGYGTAAHLAGLKTLGVTPEHRLSFAPVREAHAAWQAREVAA